MGAGKKPLFRLHRHHYQYVRHDHADCLTCHFCFDRSIFSISAVMGNGVLFTEENTNDNGGTYNDSAPEKKEAS
jgi:hypothetical protein